MNIADLLMPIADAELRDPELERLETRARREAKRRAQEAWHYQWLRCEEAKHAREAARCRRVVANYHRGWLGDMAPEEAEHRRLVRESLKLMHVPAVRKPHLNEKKRLVPFLAANKAARTEELEALVAADEARLARS